MSYTLLEFPEIVKELARDIEQVPEVVQVRVHPVIRQAIRDMTGDDGLTFMAMVEQNGAHDVFVPIAVFLPQVIYGNKTSHPKVIESFKQKIKEYREVGIVSSAAQVRGPSVEVVS